MPTLELRWHGPVYGQSGYEQLTRAMLIELDKLGVKIELHPAWQWNVERVNLPFNVVSRLQRMTKTRVMETAPLVMHQKMWEEAGRWPGSKYIYTLFETNRVPSIWRDDFEKANGLMVFTEWNRKTWIEDGIPEEKITSLGHAVDWDGYDPAKVKPVDIVNKKGFVFLANGDFIERKNFDLLIESYCKEFKASDDVCLVLKTHYGGFIKPFKEALHQRVTEMAKRWAKRPPRILMCCDKIAEEEVPALYAAAHCYVLPSRGEGLGMPYLEAMASGIPVIATGWGGQTDFISYTEQSETSTGILLPYDLRPIEDVEFIKKCPHAVGHKWAEAELETLRQAMRWCFENRKDAADMGARARESLRHASWKKVALRLLGTVYKPVMDIERTAVQAAGGAK